MDQNYKFSVIFIKSFFFSLLIFIISFLLETFFNQMILSKCFDFYTAGTFLVLILTPQIFSVYFVFCFGVLQDLLTTGILGISTFSYIASIIMLSSLGLEYYKENFNKLNIILNFTLFYILVFLIRFTITILIEKFFLY